MQVAYNIRYAEYLLRLSSLKYEVIGGWTVYPSY